MYFCVYPFLNDLVPILKTTIWDPPPEVSRGFICVSWFMFACVCMHVFFYVYACICVYYTHTHTHTLMSPHPCPLIHDFAPFISGFQVTMKRMNICARARAHTHTHTHSCTYALNAVRASSSLRPMLELECMPTHTYTHIHTHIHVTLMHTCCAPTQHMVDSCRWSPTSTSRVYTCFPTHKHTHNHTHIHSPTGPLQRCTCTRFIGQEHGRRGLLAVGSVPAFDHEK